MRADCAADVQAATRLLHETVHYRQAQARPLGQVVECAVGEHDRVVWLARVGDGHRHARHLHGGKEDVAAFVQAAVPDPAGLPVVHAGVVPGRYHRVDSIALDLASSPYAAALAASLHTEVFLERVVPG
ncbi:hypothetical protein RCH14_003773 [Massilia sp. MP_M2]